MLPSENLQSGPLFEVGTRHAMQCVRTPTAQLHQYTSPNSLPFHPTHFAHGFINCSTSSPSKMSLLSRESMNGHPQRVIHDRGSVRTHPLCLTTWTNLVRVWKTFNGTIMLLSSSRTELVSSASNLSDAAYCESNLSSSTVNRDIAADMSSAIEATP